MAKNFIVIQDDKILFGSTKEVCMEFAKATWIANKNDPRPSRRVYVYQEVKEFRVKEK